MKSIEMYVAYNTMLKPSLVAFIWTMLLLLVPATCCPFLLKPTTLGFGHGIMMGGLHIMIAKNVPEKKLPVKIGEEQLVLRGEDSSCPGSSTSNTLSNSKNFK